MRWDDKPENVKASYHWIDFLCFPPKLIVKNLNIEHNQSIQSAHNLFNQYILGSNVCTMPALRTCNDATMERLAGSAVQLCLLHSYLSDATLNRRLFSAFSSNNTHKLMDCIFRRL